MKNGLALAGSIGAAVGVCGCANMRPVEELRFERIDSRPVSVASVRAYALDKDNAILVAGSVKRNFGYSCPATSGHLDVRVLSEDGKARLEGVATYSPILHRNRGFAGRSSYTFHLPASVVDDNTVRISHHADARKNCPLQNLSYHKSLWQGQA